MFPFTTAMITFYMLWLVKQREQFPKHYILSQPSANKKQTNHPANPRSFYILLVYIVIQHTSYSRRV